MSNTNQSMKWQLGLSLFHWVHGARNPSMCLWLNLKLLLNVLSPAGAAVHIIEAAKASLGVDGSHHSTSHQTHSFLPSSLLFSYSYPFLFPGNALGNLLVSAGILESNKWTSSLNGLLLNFCLVKSSQHLGTPCLFFSSAHLWTAQWASPLFSILWLGDFSEVNVTAVHYLFTSL